MKSIKLDGIDIKDIISIAKKAGQRILGFYDNDIEVVTKQDSSPLTKADLAAHNLIIDSLKNLFPDMPILSEESKEIAWDERKKWKAYWLVDPLDGTKEFINKNGEFTVNIALIENHKPVLGVVYAPVIDTTWVGSINYSPKKIVGNTIRNIQVKKHMPGEVWKVVGSRSHAGETLLDFLEKLGDYELLSKGSSIKICMIAEGAAHIYPRLGLTSEWDTAAAHAVVNAAGGRVCEYNSDKEITYNTKESLLNPFFVAG